MRFRWILFPLVVCAAAIAGAGCGGYYDFWSAREPTPYVRPASPTPTPFVDRCFVGWENARGALLDASELDMPFHDWGVPAVALDADHFVILWKGLDPTTNRFASRAVATNGHLDVTTGGVVVGGSLEVSGSGPMQLLEVDSAGATTSAVVGTVQSLMWSGNWPDPAPGSPPSGSGAEDVVVDGTAETIGQTAFAGCYDSGATP